MPMRPLLERFADGTTMHGIPRAIKAKSIAGRVFWSLACLAATSMFMLQFVQLLQKYYSYPKRVTIEVVPMSISFPSISLCNMRNLDNNIMNQLNQIFKIGEDPMEWKTAVNATHDPFIEAYMDVVSKYYPMFRQNDSDLTVFATILTRTTLATNINKTIVSKAGVPYKEFIVTCRFSGKGCNRTQDFTHFFDPYYYNCFTYKAPPTKNKEETLAEGVENGWSTTVLTGSGMLDSNENVRIIPGSHEYMSPMSSSEGVRVVIHPPDTTPYPHTEGFDVPPGYSVTFGVKARQNIRIGPPHGNCSSINPLSRDHDGMYRLISCQKQCLQRTVVRECGCKDISLPGQEDFPNHRFCSADDELPLNCREHDYPECYEALNRIYERYICAKEVKWQYARNATATRVCGCYPPCNEITYDVTYSLSKWPAASFDGDEAYIDIFGTEQFPERFNVEEDGPQKMKMYSNYFDPANRRKAMMDFSRLNVYIADSNVLKTEEAQEYVQSQLLSDIGGQLGLWVGISVITLAEMLELVMDFCHYCSSKHGPHSEGKNFSKDPEEEERFQPTQCNCGPSPAGPDYRHCQCQHSSRNQTPRGHRYGNGVMPMSQFESDPLQLV